MPYSKLHPFVGVLLFSLLAALPLTAANLKSAEITAIVNDVSVINAGQGSRPAKLDETISGQSSVQTGIKSRTELLFSDKTMARLGANSMFSFTNGTRDIDLKQGTMLLQVPKNAGGAKITTAAVTAAITGTTIMIEYFPGGFTKVIVLEGTLRLFLNNRVGESTLLGPGKMVILNPNAKQIPEPVDVDIKRLVKTSKLVQAIDGANMDLKIVEGEIANQEKQKKKGDLIGTNLVITGSGTEVIMASEDLLNTLQNASFEQQELLGQNSNGGKPPSGNNSNPPAPDDNSAKYGPVTTITSPDPYIINSSTVIITDPEIVTNGISSPATIYNSSSPVFSGTPSSNLFGSTSSFDNVAGFDSNFFSGEVFVARFSDLSFQGAPTFNTAGGPLQVALISEAGLSASGTFNLDFSSLTGVLLASNGPLSLGSNVNITGPSSTLALYARGPTGNISVNSNISMPVSGSNFTANAQSQVTISSHIAASKINLFAINDVLLQPSALLSAANIFIQSTSGTVTIDGDNIDTAALASFGVQSETLLVRGDYQPGSGVFSNFSIGEGGITATAANTHFSVTEMLTTGNIDFSAATSSIEATDIIAASGAITVSGQIIAGSVGAFGNLSALSISSDSNINSTSGNVVVSQDITAAFNINAGGFIRSSSGDITADTITAGGYVLANGGNITTTGDITAGDAVTATGSLSSGGSITATANSINAATVTAAGNISGQNVISGGDLTSTGGDIIATIGNITSTGGTISAFGNISAAYDVFSGAGIQGASLTAGHNITSADAISVNGNIFATGDIDVTTGGILAGGNITATKITVFNPGFEVESTGSITATYLVGPSVGGITTYRAGTSITANAIDNFNGTVRLRAPSISLVSATSGTTTLLSSQFDNPSARLLENLLIYTDNITPMTINLDGNVGSAANPLTTITTDSIVSWVGAGFNLYANNVGTGSINVNGLYAIHTNTGTGNLTTSTINRTSNRSAAHDIAVGGILSASSGILFGGVNGTTGEDGGSLVIAAPVLSFGFGSSDIFKATFTGGDGTSGKGGLGGTFGATATSGDFTLAADINANGGSSLTGNGGAGGQVSLTTSTSLTDRTMTVNGSVAASGNSGKNGGGGGSITLSSNNLVFGPNAAVYTIGGNATSGTAGNGGYISVNSTGDNVSITADAGTIIESRGGFSNTGQGGNGAQIEITSAGANAPITLNGVFKVDGGQTGLSGGQGGNGGYINVFATGNNSDINIASATLSALGGDTTTGNSVGGNGGSIFLNSAGGNVTVGSGSVLEATTGLNHGSTLAGSNGGNIVINAKKHVSIAGDLTASSNDVPGKRVSNGPGNITVTSTETNAGLQGITIANTSQLLALLTATQAPASGGTIKFQSSGGKISLDGKIQADKGKIEILNNASNNGRIDIVNGAILRADIIKAEVLGTNGVLTINGGGAGGLTADSQIKLMASQSSGTVLFTGGIINLTAPQILVNAHTVTVTGDTRVNNNGATTVGAVNHNYTNGVGPTGLGGFRDVVSQTAP